MTYFGSRKTNRWPAALHVRRLAGTPLGDRQIKTGRAVTWRDMVRSIATARLVMPKSMVRLSAGRMEFSQEAQAMMFLAGANSIFTGDKLLTTANPKFSEAQWLYVLHVLYILGYTYAIYIYIY